MRLQLITPTGDRPKAWALCQRWMERQTWQGQLTWHVVDDGHDPAEMSFSKPGAELAVHRLRPMNGNSQQRNLIWLMEMVDRRQPVVVIEDDDWYAPDWLSHVAQELDQAELVGENQARYYNVALRRGRQLSNISHASLCATALRDSALDTFDQVLHESHQFFDLELWRRHPRRHLFEGHRVVGIKGMPGRQGIGMGHGPSLNGFDDRDGTMLHQWVGDDAPSYLEDIR
jgi:hypothetical protein